MNIQKAKGLRTAPLQTLTDLNAEDVREISGAPNVRPADGRETGFVSIARAWLALKKWTRFCIAFFFTLPFIALGLSTPAWCSAQVYAQKPVVSDGVKCMAFIETSRPGGAVTVPYGNVHRSAAKARKDARNRCSLTTLAQDGWGPCRTWCEEVNP